MLGCWIALVAFMFIIVEPTYAQVAKLRGNKSIASFSRSKSILKSNPSIFPRTFYCKCLYLNKKIDIDSCQAQHRIVPIRAYQLEWEHVVPASELLDSFEQNLSIEWLHRMMLNSGKKETITYLRKMKSKKKLARYFYSRVCPKVSRRACARKFFKTFKRMEADLYNLVPVQGHINYLRSNFIVLDDSKVTNGSMFGFILESIGLINSGFKYCNLGIRKTHVYPDDLIKGEIARIHLYMNWAYNTYNLSQERIKLYTDWSRSAPPKSLEIARYKWIAQIQGNINPFAGVPHNEY